MPKARPLSAQSKAAWSDFGGSQPGSQFDFDKQNIRDDPDLITPVAAEGGSGRKKRPASAVTPATQKSRGFLGKIGHGIRSTC
ncbi:hypothetical protein MAR_029357 [Mya arenaria]|uniref:Uncharacterized protein n=1 Tax=Mya arenaria TaxID=6604 RepID=A0ABY7DG77_MYAAR|nr:hypothetical protein MAR_029357 [Mya arenaria]